MGAAWPIQSFTWAPSNQSPRATLLCIHGLGLHAGTFKVFGERMAELGIATYALDVRGCGRWQTGKGKSNLNLAACTTDVTTLLSVIRQRHPHIPAFILGESLGSAIAVAAAVKERQLIDGMILSAPARFSQDHGREIADVVWHALTSFGRPMCIEGAVGKFAPDVISWHRSDPLIRLRYSISELFHMGRFLIASFDALPKLPDVPVLVIQGHADELIKTQRTIAYFERLPCTDKQLLLLGDQGHLILTTRNLPHQLTAMVGSWLTDRLPENTEELPPHLRRAS
jgi:alpha-beta hydrolase superfamily lysophospholipase